jgi:ABC-2 type transport system ATP-binding protein
VAFRSTPGTAARAVAGPADAPPHLQPDQPTLTVRHDPTAADPDPDAGDRAPAAITAADLHVVRGHRAALRGVSCRIEAGRVTAVLGPAAAGKSTLLRCVLGRQRPTSGELTVLGQPAGARDLRHRVVAVTARPAHADRSARESVRSVARVFRAPRARVREVADRLGIDLASDRPVGGLSPVARRRVALATALVGAPDLVLLDDFMTGLDPVHGDALWRDLDALAASGVGVVLTTSTADVAARCARLLLLRDGVLLADETPAGLRSLAGTGDLTEAVVRLARQQDAAG